ncbi:glycosyltransferase family 2 protein [Sunxiuqinia sp. sy24]|uniref:glycosyltransferase family 2 protein n=1 Tax=Sunxiuqinia sp. sy24 TaxID=3461495 RepID=UPI004045DBCC
MIELILVVFEYIFLLYAILIVVHYLVLAIIALFELRKVVRENELAQYKSLMIYERVPLVSIVAPAFNEERTIVENINGLLHLRYSKYEIIVVNDGSTDETLQTAIDAFELVKVDFALDSVLDYKTIRGIYRSNLEAYANLIIVDKENGGKSDALNAGISIAKGQYFMTIDVDTIIDPYVIQYLIKPFFEYSDSKVIATGGTIRVANSCEFRKGHLLNVNIPKNFLARFQVLEYNRAFLLSRLAWKKLNGMVLISGALGMFDRKLVLKCGGYSTKTVGEDMELILRMRRYMYDREERHKVILVPHPMSWTEVPEDWRVFGRQRSRWTRGLIDCMITHRKMWFNPRYKIVGLFSMPTVILYEWFAPVIQMLGMVYFTYLVIIDHVNWPFFLVLLLFVYLFGIAFSTWALICDHFAYHQYKSTKHIVRLLVIAWIEAFTFNLVNSFFSLKGNFEYFFKKNRSDWGTMSRTGFVTIKKP